MIISRGRCNEVGQRLTRTRRLAELPSNVKHIIGICQDREHVAVVFTMQSSVPTKEADSHTTDETAASLSVSVNDDTCDREQVAVYRLSDLALLGVCDIGNTGGDKEILDENDVWWFGAISDHVQMSFPFLLLLDYPTFCTQAMTFRLDPLARSAAFVGEHKSEVRSWMHHKQKHGHSHRL